MIVVPVEPMLHCQIFVAVLIWTPRWGDQVFVMNILMARKHTSAAQTSVLTLWSLKKSVSFIIVHLRDATAYINFVFLNLLFRFYLNLVFICAFVAKDTSVKSKIIGQHIILHYIHNTYHWYTLFYVDNVCSVHFFWAILFILRTEPSSLYVYTYLDNNADSDNRFTRHRWICRTEVFLCGVLPLVCLQNKSVCVCLHMHSIYLCDK